MSETCLIYPLDVWSFSLNSFFSLRLGLGILLNYIQSCKVYLLKQKLTLRAHIHSNLYYSHLVISVSSTHSNLFCRCPFV